MNTQKALTSILVFGYVSNLPISAAPLCSLSADETKVSQCDEQSISRDNKSGWQKWKSTINAIVITKVDLITHAFVANANEISNEIDVRISRDRRIVRAELVKSSGNPEFDSICLAAINALAGSPILQFPNPSYQMLAKEKFSFRLQPNPSPQKKENFSLQRIQSLLKLTVSDLKHQLNSPNRT